MKFRLTGISITGEWTKNDWYDFYHSLEAFEKRCAVRHGELPVSHQADPADAKEPCPRCIIYRGESQNFCANCGRDLRR